MTDHCILRISFGVLKSLELKEELKGRSEDGNMVAVTVNMVCPARERREQEMFRTDITNTALTSKNM